MALPPASMGREEEGAPFFTLTFFFYSSLFLLLHLGPGDLSHLSIWPPGLSFLSLDSNL